MYSIPKSCGVLILAGILIVFSQYSAGIAVSVGTLIGILLIISICLLAIVLQKIFAKINFPLLAWASTAALILCIPQSPFAKILSTYLNQVDFLAITVPVLTFAGIAVADRLVELKQLSYKVFFVAIFVFAGRLLLSAIFAELVIRHFN